MGELWLLRHAKAVQEKDREDRDRPLAPKGEAAMHEIAAWAAAENLAPTMVLCSSAARTRQTLALLKPVLAGRPEIKIEDGLYLADAERLLQRLRRVGARTGSVLVVGHNPGLHELALALVGRGGGGAGRRLAEGMPTGALAGLSFEGPFAGLEPGLASLDHFVTPKELRD